MLDPPHLAHTPLTQIKARHHWITLTEGILEVHTRFLGALPDFTVAQRLAGRTLARQDPFARPPPPPPQDKLMGLAFFAWRMWSRIKSRGRQVRSRAGILCSQLSVTCPIRKTQWTDYWEPHQPDRTFSY